MSFPDDLDDVLAELADLTTPLNKISEEVRKIRDGIVSPLQEPLSKQLSDLNEELQKMSEKIPDAPNAGRMFERMFYNLENMYFLVGLLCCLMVAALALGGFALYHFW